MRKKIFYMTFLVLLFVSCEEYYTPDLEVVPGMLVVESHLTNDPEQNFVKLSKTRNFYSTDPEEKVIGAKVELTESGGPNLSGIESDPGYFTFAKTPVPGKRYSIRIVYKNDIYESESVLMPPLPAIDLVYTKHKIAKSFRTDAYGSPTQIETLGRELCIDAPISNSLEYYRFQYRAILQWTYTPPALMGTPPTTYGWRSFYDNGLFNIAGAKKFSVSDAVKEHPILFIGYNQNQYLDSASMIPNDWILLVDQYGISKESYDFHEKLNKQFSAEGSLFDPVLTQVYGNIKCKTDPDKIAVGFFDLNSYRHYRYFLRMGSADGSPVHLRQIHRYPDIPDSGSEVGTIPSFWENIY